MNLKNKTDEELWDMLNKIDEYESPITISLKHWNRYDIHQEIIRREKENE